MGAPMKGRHPATETVATESSPPGPQPVEMGKIGRHGLVYGAGILLSRTVAFIMLPVYTRFLTPADYGALQLVAMTLEVVSIVAGSRIAQGVFRFYHKADTESERQDVLGTALVMLGTAYVLASLAMFAGSGALAELIFGSPDGQLLIQVASGQLAFEAFILVPFAFLQVSNRSTTYFRVSATRLALQVGFNLVFVVGFRLAALGVLLGNLIAAMVMGTYLSLTMIREIGFRFSRPAARDLLRFGIPLVLTQVATFIGTYGDRYVLQKESGEAVVGLYALAYQFGFLLFAVGFNPFKTVWDPNRFAIAKRHDRDDIYARGFVYCNVVLFTVAVLIVTFVADFLGIVADPAFYTASRVVPIVVIAYVFQAWEHYTNLGIMIRERTEAITVANWAAAGVAIVGYLTLIPRYLAFGAAWATVIAFGFRFVLIYGMAQRLWPVRYRWGPVFRMAGIAVVAGGAAISIPTPNRIVSILWHVAVIVAFVGTVSVSGVLNQDERTWLLRRAGRLWAQRPWARRAA